MKKVETISKPESVFVNIHMVAPMADVLDKMAQDDDLDRSKFIRNLIRKEWRRRQKREVNKSIAQTTH